MHVYMEKKNNLLLVDGINKIIEMENNFNLNSWGLLPLSLC